MPKTWTSSHVYGDCAVNHQHNLFYVNIPKCASTWSKTYIGLQGGWLGDNFIENRSVGDKKTGIIFLRDPLERWVSGRPLFDKILNLNILNINEIYDLDFANKMPFFVMDEHSAPQYDFISELNFDRCVFFLCDQNLLENFSGFAKSKNMPVVDLRDFENVGEKNAEYEQYKKNWLYLYSIPEIKDAFDKVYQKDYELINKVNFFKVNLA